MSGLPWGYDQQMFYNAWTDTSNVKDTQSLKSQFFQRYLWQDLIGVIKWEIPKHWNYDYFTYCLYMYGYVCVLNTDKFGVIPQQCGLSGYDVFYAPNRCIVTNPLLKGITEPRIGIDCELIYVNADYGPMWDLITFYADLMALTVASIGTNLINSKLAYLLVAGNKAKAETLKNMYQEISGGSPAYVIDEEMISRDGTPLWQIFDSHLGSNYITDKLLVDFQKIINLFHTAIGIPNANTEKKERMIVDETNANNVATAIGTETRLERMERQAKKVEQMFGITCKPTWRHDPNETGLEEGGIDAKRSSGGTNSIQTKS